LLLPVILVVCYVLKRVHHIGHDGHPVGACVKTFVTFCLFMICTIQSSAADTFSISYENGRVVRRFPVNTRPVIGLALSGGGARGIAHVGVIEVLEENGIHVDRIAGTSMGSIVGGLYAAGYRTEVLERMFEELDWSSYFSNTPKRRTVYVTEKETFNWTLFDVRFNALNPRIPSSLLMGQNIISLLSWLALAPTYECGGDFDNLPIPFRAVSTDLNTGEMVVLKSGNLARALQASSTIPLIFSPVEWGKWFLVDGGLKNNLPVDVAREMGSDFVIAVAIDESMHKSDDLDNPLNIADQTTSILMKISTELSRTKADYVITPDMEAFSSGEFKNIGDIIEQGRTAARIALPGLRESLEQKKSTYRKTFVREIRVSPLDEEEGVKQTLSHFLRPASECSYAVIADALDVLWKTGRYWNISADVNPHTGIVHFTLYPVPAAITLLCGTGNPSASPNRTYTVMARESSPLPVSHIIGRIDSLMTVIRADGYSFAHINDMEYYGVNDSLTIYSTAPRISRIYIDENLTTRRSVIMREITFRTGELLDLTRLMKTIDNLYGTNFFEWVYADVRPYNDGVGIGIHIKEKNWTLMRIGIRFDETNSAEGRVALSRENILGSGNQFGVIGQSGKRKKLMMVQDKIDRIYKSLYSFDIKTYNLLRNRPMYSGHKHFLDYEDDRYGTVISLGQQMDKFGNAVLQFKTETVKIHFSPSANRKNRKRELRSFVMQSLIDSYDRYPFPTNGKINLISIESANEFFGGTEQYVKIYWGGSYVRTYKQLHTFTASFSLGTADPSTPSTESFTLGGNLSRVYCYDFESGMSHYYADFQGLYSEERTGNYLAVGKLAYRLHIPKFFYLTFIYNIGNVWDNNDTITFDSVLHGYGVRA